jgi:hypothetical protein
VGGQVLFYHGRQSYSPSEFRIGQQSGNRKPLCFNGLERFEEERS